jgi:hypothetical protein
MTAGRATLIGLIVLSSAALAASLAERQDSAGSEPTPSGPMTQPPPADRAAGPSTRESPETMSPDFERLSSLALRGAALGGVDPFSPYAEPEPRAIAAPSARSSRPPPTAPTPAAPPPAPVAEPTPAPAQPIPAPFRIIGQTLVDGEITLFLEDSGRTYAVRAGESIAGGWRVESVSDGRAILASATSEQRTELVWGTP